MDDLQADQAIVNYNQVALDGIESCQLGGQCISKLDSDLIESACWNSQLGRQSENDIFVLMFRNFNSKRETHIFNESYAGMTRRRKFMEVLSLFGFMCFGFARLCSLHVICRKLGAK